MHFDIAVSGLRSNQFALSTVAHNLANANTEGYHRRRITFASRMPQRLPDLYLGTGVEIGTVDRWRNQLLEASFTNAVSDLESVEQQLTLERRVEELFLPGEGSLQESMIDFFNELSSLSANPGEVVQRNSVVQTAATLGQKFNNAAGYLADIQSNIFAQVRLEVDELNRDVAELVDLENQIRLAEVHSVPNDLLDRRDQLINRLAEKIDVQRNENIKNGMGLALAGHSITLGQEPVAFEAYLNESGQIGYRYPGASTDVQFAGGRLVGLQHAYNETIPHYQNRLDELAGGLIRQVNQVHAQGIGATGPFLSLTGNYEVTDPDLPLSDAGLPFSVEAGELYLSVVDGNNDRRTVSISFDPDVDSLNDISTRLNALDGIRSSVNGFTGALQIGAEPGFRFDFTGNLESIPDLSTYTGTSQPRISGRYLGSENQDMRVEIVGTGTVGVTDGLLARVYDGSGVVVNEVSIGSDYSAGSELEVYEGVSISFAAGDVVDGEEFTTDLVSDPDSGGFLSALGFNSFFEGGSAINIEVNELLLEDPNRLAASKTGEDGDTFNLIEIVELRDIQLLAGETFDDYLADTVADIGLQVRSTDSVRQSLSELKDGYKSEIDAFSGVDVNEELLDMSKYQQAYEASVQVIRTMEAMLDELFTILR